MSIYAANQCQRLYNQLDLGSCVSNAVASCIEFDQIKQNKSTGTEIFVPSRLKIYYDTRVVENTVTQDVGCQPRDAMKVVNRSGACPESMWPYDVSKFADQPPQDAYIEAAKHKVIQYQAVNQDLTDMKACLASGYPFLFGLVVYSAFESDEVAKTGVLNMPGAGEEILGGHCVVACGYDDASQRFIVRNSWGPRFGQKGYFTMPFEYLLRSDLSSDMWTVALIG